MRQSSWTVVSTEFRAPLLLVLAPPKDCWFKLRGRKSSGLHVYRVFFSYFGCLDPSFSFFGISFDHQLGRVSGALSSTKAGLSRWLQLRSRTALFHTRRRGPLRGYRPAGKRKRSSPLR